MRKKKKKSKENAINISIIEISGIYCAKQF